ncbi:MAG: YbaK/EbsC family protein [Thermodesulfobacteriota bacterium]
MSEPLSPSARKVQLTLEEAGFSCLVTELPASTRTSKEAARAVGCEVGQIAKSLVFRGLHSNSPLLVIASGANRVDEKRLGALAGEPVGKADAEFVRTQTGFAIGGIPPLGHVKPLKTIIDEDLLLYKRIWAAAGTPHAVFELDPADLEKMTGGRVRRIKS